MTKIGETTYLDREYYAALLFSGLKALKQVQDQVSGMVDGCITPDSPTKHQLQLYTLAAVRELTEWLDTLNWKDWKESREVDRTRCLDEFADVLAFLGLLLVYMDRLGMTPMDVATAYILKSEVNIARFNGEVDGYKVQGGSSDHQPG